MCAMLNLSYFRVMVVAMLDTQIHFLKNEDLHPDKCGLAEAESILMIDLFFMVTTVKLY